MKHLLTEKAEKLVEKHHEKYQRQNGESFREMKDYDHSDHLINLSMYEKGIALTLTPKQQEIIDAYYGVNNGNYFNSLFSDFIIQLGNDARETYGKSDQQAILRNGINSIVQKIAFDSFIRSGVKTIFDKQVFQYI